MTEQFWAKRLWTGAGEPRAGVTIDVTDGRIAAINDAAAPPPGSTALHGLTMPGCANAHSHAFHRALRGRTHDGGGTFWTWRDEMYRVAARLDPDSYYELARATYGEMLLAGFTVVGEFHYVHHQPGGVPYSDRNAMGEALMAAANDVGIRITLLDTCYLHGGIDRPLSEIQTRFCDGTAQDWALRVAAHQPVGLAKIAAAIHSVRAVLPMEIDAIVEFTERSGVVLHTHVSEQPLENDQCLDAYGCTPIELLERCGALSERMAVVHATHTTSNDIDLLAARAASVVMCPTTERDLADGVGPSATYRRRAVAMSIGSDSHAVIDPFEETRAIELDERLVSLQRGTHQPQELLSIATANGYRALGWPDGGRIEVGGLADFITIGLDSVRLAGTTSANVLASIVYSAGPADVLDVVVAGRHVIRNGQHQRFDVAAALSSAIAALES